MIMGIVLAVCAVIFIAQNMSRIDLNILFFTFSSPALIFYIILLGIGFALGILVKSKNKH